MVEMLFLLMAIGGFFLFYFLIREGSDPSVDFTQARSPSAPKIKAQSEIPARLQIPNFPKAKVKWIVDGDTVIVALGWREVTIRLDSIDCPEDGQEWGDTAKYGLIKLISNEIVHLEEYGLDDYGRTLATIYVFNKQKKEWVNVNERMVMLGHAWVLRKYYDHLPRDRQNKLNRLEKWAKSRSVGLWRNPNPMPPWVWRKENEMAF